MFPNFKHFISVTYFFVLVLFLFDSCKPSKRTTRRLYEQGLSNQPYDAIIVPGYPYTGEPWNDVQNIRTRWADYLYKKGYAKNIIFSGSAVYTKYYESKVMALYAEAMGIPSEHVFTEQTAEHTTENVYYSYRIAKKLGFKKMALASDPNQTNKMRHFINKYELPIKLFPMIYDTLRAHEIPEPKIDPGSAIKENFVSIVERQSLYQRLRGTFGRKIIWHDEDLKKKRFKRRFKDRIVYD